ncbi:hypothetical protein BST61_g523 [Cercospora zeina]
MGGPTSSATAVHEGRGRHHQHGLRGAHPLRAKRDYWCETPRVARLESLLPVYRLASTYQFSRTHRKQPALSNH